MSRPEPIRFFLPGPSYVREEIREAMARPMLGHRSAAFRELYAGLGPRLQEVFRTRGEVLVATASATLVMESAIVSTVHADLLCLTCGAFAERWQAIARLHGKKTDAVAVPWGEPVDPSLVRRALRRKRYEAVTLVHNETSTGVISPLQEIARAVREESDALLLVDTVSSLGGAPVEPDAWGVDLALAGTQKALALPPGLTLFTLSDRAAECAGRVTGRGFYTDLLRYRDAHRKNGTITTPALPQIFALDRQLDRILAEGVAERWARHEELRRRTAEWAAARGLRYVSAAGAGSPTVSCLEPPPGVAAPDLVARLAREGFVVGGGYGDWRSRTFRIGHMGEVRQADLDDLLAAIDAVAAPATGPAPRRHTGTSPG
jgi:aspartate aminotransferase-like enzyme